MVLTRLHHGIGRASPRCGVLQISEKRDCISLRVIASAHGVRLYDCIRYAAKTTFTAESNLFSATESQGPCYYNNRAFLFVGRKGAAVAARQRATEPYLRATIRPTVHE
jgi:hypothetical protein